MRPQLLAALAVLAVVAAYVGVTTELRWVAVMASAAIAYGFLSPVVAARRLYFLASASPHSALFAAVLSIPVARLVGVGGEYLWAVLIGTLSIYVVGYMIHKGIEPDVATSAFIAFTTSGSVIAIYYVLTRYPMEANVWAVIVGDPLLASWWDAAYALGVALATALFIYVTRREQVCLGIDRDYVRLAGVNTGAYDALVFTLLAVTTVALIRVVGFVLEHVLVLLPSAIATTWSRSARGAMATSVYVSLLASLVGLYLSVALDLAPAGVTGLILLFTYIAVLAIRRWWYG
ncbi:MAG: ABC transporter [Desulfurococcales archaeon ex4484_204]|nr:MAG: ABC transporter [Desulfurococcales archaeon ex4484_204]